MRSTSGVFLLSVEVILLVLTTSLQADQPTPDADLVRGREALRAHKYKDAIDAFKKAEKRLHDECPECFMGIAVACIHTGDKDGALKNSDRAIALAKDSEQLASLHNLKGQACMLIDPDRKSFQKAEQEFRQAVDLDPKDPDLHLNLACALMKQSKDDEAIPELKRCLELHPSATSTDLANRYLAKPQLGREELAPDFLATTLQGDQISLKQFAGKMVVLDFWATWCPPCRAAIPELKELQKKYASDRLVVVSVSGDSDEREWKDFVAKHEMNWIQVRDSNREVGDKFRVRAIPTYVVINEDGAVQTRIVGKNPQESIVHRLKDLLASNQRLTSQK
jgi:thiol-disulfide isomerase/thioredoxin